MNFAARTNIGLRLRNEDSLYLPQAEGVQLVAVADGMGGHAGGKRASAAAIEAVSSSISKSSQSLEQDPVQRIRQAIKAANEEIYQEAQLDEGCRGMGTTLTLALLFCDQFIAANIGDSRLYHFDGWNLTQVTHDHSFVAVLVANGAITELEASSHPQRNIITRSLGTSLNEEADFFVRRWSEGDILLLSTDGLHGSVKDEEIEASLRLNISLHALAGRLVKLALKAGATDNISVVLAKNTGGDAA